jgi:hypothetical protein
MFVLDIAIFNKKGGKCLLFYYLINVTIPLRFELLKPTPSEDVLIDVALLLVLDDVAKAMKT